MLWGLVIIKKKLRDEAPDVFGGIRKLFTNEDCDLKNEPVCWFRVGGWRGVRLFREKEEHIQKERKGNITRSEKDKW